MPVLFGIVPKLSAKIASSIVADRVVVALSDRVSAQVVRLVVKAVALCRVILTNPLLPALE